MNTQVFISFIRLTYLKKKDLTIFQLSVTVKVAKSLKFEIQTDRQVSTPYFEHCCESS